jgi:predicted transcriptional regulator
MPRSPSSHPTEVELQILRSLWDLGPSPVRDIHARLQTEKATNYSTTVKMLAVMLQKGLLTRNEDEQPYVYRAALTRKRAAQGLLRDLIDKVYEGSAKSLVIQALSSSRATREELSEIRRVLDQMEDRQR